MEFIYYRYIVFCLISLLIFTDACARYIAPLAMIGGMVKKNCSDPQDEGELCWSDQLQANFVGAFYYGFALQMISTYIATRLGFRVSICSIALAAGIIQITVPVLSEYSGALAAVLQGIRGFLDGIILPCNYDNARKWSLGNEGKMVLSFGGLVLYLGYGVGPFVVGILTEKVGWKISFYLSGSVYILLSIMLCALFPENPTDAKLMSKSERAMFEEKKQKKRSNKSENAGDETEVSFLSVLRRPYLYFFCVYNFAQLTTQYPEFTTVPFFMNTFWGVTTEPLSYLSLGLSIIAALSVAAWKLSLPFLDSKISWIKCRIGFLIIPMVIRNISLAALPFTDNFSASIFLLALNNILLGTVFSGGIVTFNYELDPFNGPLLFSTVQTFSQTSGFLIPLIREAMTRTYRR